MHMCAHVHSCSHVYCILSIFLLLEIQAPKLFCFVQHVRYLAELGVELPTGMFQQTSDFPPFSSPGT